MAKLTFDEIREIRTRRRDGETLFDLAKTYNVSTTTIFYHTKDIKEVKALTKLERVKQWERRMGILPIDIDTAVNS